MTDQITGLENAGPNNFTSCWKLNLQDLKMADQKRTETEKSRAGK